MCTHTPAGQLQVYFTLWDVQLSVCLRKHGFCMHVQMHQYSCSSWMQSLYQLTALSCKVLNKAPMCTHTPAGQLQETHLLLDD